MNQDAWSYFMAEQLVRDGLDRRVARKWATVEALRNGRQFSSISGIREELMTAFGRVAALTRVWTRPAAPNRPCAPDMISDCAKA